MGVCNCSMFCCTLLYFCSSIAIILMGKRDLVALLNLSSWCLVMVEWLFLAVPWGRLRFVFVVFPDHTHLLFFRMGAGIESGPVAFLGFILKRIFGTPSSVTCMASMPGKGVSEGFGTWSWSS